MPPAWLVLALALATYVGVAVGRWPRLKGNRATIALVGATALVAIGAIPLDEAFDAIEMNTLALLFGLMVLNANLRLAGFFAWAASLTLRTARGPKSLLALLLGTAGLLSALFLNDTICIMLTPLVAEIVRALRRDPVPYLAGLMVATNAGSVATVTGNPQNMLIGFESGLSYAEFALALTPVALLSLGAAWALLVFMFPAEFRGDGWTRVAPPAPAVQGPLLRKSLGVTALLLALLLAGVPMALAALVAAALLLLTRRVEPERVFAEFDWQLLVFFAGLFVVTGALRTSGLSDAVTGHLRALCGDSLGGTMVLTAALSNLVSNVPAVLLLGPLAAAAEEPRTAWLALAAASTLSGNLTLLGSVANLIVAEQARGRGLHVGFVAHLRVGVPVTLATLVLGWAWLALIT